MLFEIMAANPIIIVCGADHSGTSMITAFLSTNGGWIGDVEEIKRPVMPAYKRFENRDFRELCAGIIIANFTPQFTQIEDFFKTLPPETVVLKYPKAVHLLAMFQERIEREIRVVFVQRDWLANTMSGIGKLSDRKPEEASGYMLNLISKAHLAAANFNGELFNVSYERLCQHRSGGDLLRFCGLPSKDIDYSAIKPEMKNF